MRKIALITGAGGGIGRATSLAALRAGFDLCLIYRRDTAPDPEIAEAAAAASARVTPLGCDLSDAGAVGQLFAKVAERFGRLDLLVNNAGTIGWEGQVREADAAALGALWAVNLTAPYLLAAGAIPLMSTRDGGRGGAIVNVSSLAARTGGQAGRVHYAASKGALNSFTLGLAREVAAEGVRVNAVLPGLIETPIHDRFGAAGHVREAAARTPMRRAGLPEEVAAAIMWLASSDASYVTGALLEIGGGL